MRRGTRLLACLLPYACLLTICVQAQTAPVKPLTVESLFQPGGLAGRGPETTEWSPDGSKLTFVQRDGRGEKGELWYADTGTGEKKVLVSAAKLAMLDPDVNKVKNEREKERLTELAVGELARGGRWVKVIADFPAVADGMPSGPPERALISFQPLGRTDVLSRSVGNVRNSTVA